MSLAESSDNLMDMETAYRHEDGTILTGPLAGREYSNDESDLYANNGFSLKTPTTTNPAAVGGSLGR